MLSIVSGLLLIAAFLWLIFAVRSASKKAEDQRKLKDSINRTVWKTDFEPHFRNKRCHQLNLNQPLG